MANIITTGVGAGAIVTISWERNTWAGSGLQPAQVKSFSGEQANTLLSDCISSVKKSERTRLWFLPSPEHRVPR